MVVAVIVVLRLLLFVMMVTLLLLLMAMMLTTAVLLLIVCLNFRVLQKVYALVIVLAPIDELIYVSVLLLIERGEECLGIRRLLGLLVAAGCLI